MEQGVGCCFSFFLGGGAKTPPRLMLSIFFHSPQQREPITVGPYYLSHPVNFPCGRKPEYPEKTHDFRQSVDCYSFHMRTGLESTLLGVELGTLEVKGEWSDHYTTEAPSKYCKNVFSSLKAAFIVSLINLVGRLISFFVENIETGFAPSQQVNFDKSNNVVLLIRRNVILLNG